MEVSHCIMPLFNNKNNLIIQNVDFKLRFGKNQYVKKLSVFNIDTFQWMF